MTSYPTPTRASKACRGGRAVRSTVAATVAIVALSLGAPVASAAFNSHTFTSCGKTGQSGPSLAQCVSAYSSTDWVADVNAFNVTAGIQYWKVPVTGTYRLTAAGAQGGGSDGAPGVLIAQDYPLTAGTNLKILVGQRGVSVPGGPIGGLAGGGGGGSFVALADSDDTPVIVAGGGGGGFDGHLDTDWPSAPGSTSSCGSAPPASYASGSGGCAGAGGTTTTSYNGSGAGGGYYSNGATNPRSGAGGGQAFVAGGTGGSGAPSGIAAPGGGFGGGGGGSILYFVRGGGGGGYSGGAGAYGAGGGGGLYFSPLSTNQTLLGTNSGDGTVEIARLTPLAPIVAGTSGLTNSDSASWEFSAQDADSYLCRVDSEPYSECTSPFAASDIHEGDHTFSVIGVSSDGQGPATDLNWTVDTAAPAAPELSSAPTGTTSENGATLEFILNEPGGTVECRLDSGSWGDCTSVIGLNGTFLVSGLADGPHTLAVRQTDDAGNVGASATSDEWLVDTTAPAAPELNGAPGSLTNLTLASISFTGEDGASFQCSLDDEPFSDCNSPWTTDDLPEGEHTFKVRQTDSVGNESPNAEATWTVAVLAVTSNPSLSVDGDTPVGVGTTISGGGQSFSGSPGAASETFRWQRCSSSVPGWCTSIPDATSSVYTLAAADVGKRVRLTVTHTTIEGRSITARSATTGIVVPTPGGSSTIGLPVGATSPAYGRPLTAIGPTWTGGLPPGIGLLYRWQRCPSSAGPAPTGCSSLIDSTGSSYTPRVADIGKKLRLLVGVSASGTATWASSTVSAIVTVRPVNTDQPTLTLQGAAVTPRRFMRITADKGSWTGLYGGRFIWSWQACTGSDDSTCTKLDGKTTSAFLPGTAQVGKGLRAALTYRSPDGYLTTAYTEISNPVTR